MSILGNEEKILLTVPAAALQMLKRLNELLLRDKVQGYLVGGMVRDALLGRETQDIDLAVKTDGVGFARLAADFFSGSFVPLDEQNGIGRMILDAAGKRWTVDFSCFNDIATDLRRRDFTIDAIAVPLDEFIASYPMAVLIDPNQGYSDLKEKTVRFVNADVFRDDAIRLLRALRIKFELGFTITAETEVQLKHDAGLIKDIAPERAREELLRLFRLPDNGEIVKYLDATGLLTAIIPELAVSRGITQPKEHHWNVLEHSLETVAALDFVLHRAEWYYTDRQILDVVPWSPEIAAHFGSPVSSEASHRVLLKIAALMHDIAKPQTRAPDENGRMRFLGHGKEGAEIAAEVLERLRFSMREIRIVADMVRFHMRPSQMSQQHEMPSHRAIYRYFRDTGVAGIDILYLNLADHLATRGPELIFNLWRQHNKMVDYVLARREEQQQVSAEKLVDGHDLIKLFDMQPGPSIGEMLEKVREEQSTGRLKNRMQALAYLSRLLGKELSCC